MKNKITQYSISSKRIKSNAKDLRKNLTPAETRFWKIVRNRNLLGLKFRRQHPIGNFIVDFYCDELKLVIEIDGDIHDIVEIAEYDKKREKYLKELDLKIERFKNEDVFTNPQIIELVVKKYLS